MNILFLILSSVYIALLLLQLELPQPIMALFKTLPIGLLIVMVLKGRSQLQNRTFITLLFALSFSALGDVLLALDTRLGRQVAIKRILGDAAKKNAVCVGVEIRAGRDERRIDLA